MHCMEDFYVNHSLNFTHQGDMLYPLCCFEEMWFYDFNKKICTSRGLLKVTVDGPKFLIYHISTTHTGVTTKIKRYRM